MAVFKRSRYATKKNRAVARHSRKASKHRIKRSGTMRRKRTSKPRTISIPSDHKISTRGSSRKRPRKSAEVQVRKRTPSPRSAKRSRIYRASAYNSPSVPIFPLFQKRVTKAFFTTPHRLPKDCCPCVFKLLGLAGRGRTEQLIDEFGLPGMTSGNIEGQFSAAWPGRTFKFVNQQGTGMSTHQFVNSVFKSLNPSHATLMGWMDAEGGRHCMSFAKNKEGVAQFFDAQTMDWANGLPAVHDVFRDKREVYTLVVNGGGMVV